MIRKIFTILHLTPSLPYISARYMPGENKAILMLLHIISYKIITDVGVYTNFFPACVRHLVLGLK